MARAGLRKGHEDSSESPSATKEVLPERMNQARCLACSESFHEESHGIGQAPIMCRTPAASVKATRRNSGFSARWTTHSATRGIRNAPRLKLHGAPARDENRAGCFYITFSAIIAQNSIVAGTTHSPGGGF